MVQASLYKNKRRPLRRKETYQDVHFTVEAERPDDDEEDKEQGTEPKITACIDVSRCDQYAFVIREE